MIFFFLDFWKKKFAKIENLINVYFGQIKTNIIDYMIKFIVWTMKLRFQGKIENKE